MKRGPLVLALALASLGRLRGRSGPTPAGVPNRGRAVSVVAESFEILVETDRGSVLLIIAWDATIAATAGVMAIGDIRVGDVVEWISNEAQSVVMVDQLRVIPSVAG